MGEEGNADVAGACACVGVTFMENGYGKDRYLVMHNDFVWWDPQMIRRRLGINCY